MSMKIIFMGTPEFAVPILDTINKSNYDLSCVYTQPPKKKNRGQKISPSAVQLYCKENNINVRCPSELDDEECDFIKKINPDVVVVVAYGKILSNNLLSLKKIKFINIHASLLPKWRGAAPIQRAIMNLDNSTGISIMKIVSKLDSGPVLLKSEINISKSDNYTSLSNQMSKLGAVKILEALRLIEEDKANYIPQDDSMASYAKKIDKSEAKINWNENANKIIAKINALNPTPGSWFKLDGSRIKVIKAIEVKKNGRPGEIIHNKLTIACKKNAIQILELKKEGRKKMEASDFMRGNKIEVGKILGN